MIPSAGSAMTGSLGPEKGDGVPRNPSKSSRGTAPPPPAAARQDDSTAAFPWKVVNWAAAGAARQAAIPGTSVRIVGRESMQQGSYFGKIVKSAAGEEGGDEVEEVLGVGLAREVEVGVV